MTRSLRLLRDARLLVAAGLCVAVVTTAAQTKITAPKNKYPVSDDVKAGRDAAAQVEKEMPLLNEPLVGEYVAGIGQRLVAAIPPEQRHPEFTYTFKVVDQKDINAFALPGGPMFLNRGMIEAAKTEGEIAGVMAHEISHVTLRHGTAQATKGEKFQIGAIAGQVLGAIVGGTAGSIIAQGSNFGLSTYFLKFSREYESQADVNGSHIMADAGYDPRDMANMFKTIEEQGGGQTPQWLSSHPNPGNRYQRINQEATLLKVAPGSRSDNKAEFDRVQARLKQLPPALTAEQIAQRQKTANTSTTGTASRTVTVAAPSSSFRTFQQTNYLKVGVPSNWDRSATQTESSTYTPSGASFQNGFTHGVEVGVTKGSGNLQRDTDALVSSLAQGNPQLRQTDTAKTDSVGGRNGLTMHLSNLSDITGQPETITLSTVQLTDGSLLYLIGVVPSTEANAYDATFKKVRQSLSIAGR